MASQIAVLKGGKRIVVAEECVSLWKKAKGLMFSKKKNLLFVFDKPQKVSLHMLFVFFPIWAVYLDEKKKVGSIEKLLPFFSTYNPQEKAKYVLELVKKPELKPGDTLTW